MNGTSLTRSRPQATSAPALIGGGFSLGVGGSGSHPLEIIRTPLHVCIESGENLLQLETGMGVQDIRSIR